MIPKQPSAASRLTPISITPKDRGAELPSWSPVPPAGGWTPAAVWNAAAAYAGDVADYATRRRIASIAASALFRELPVVKRLEIEERLRGVDHGADVLASFQRPLFADDL